MKNRITFLLIRMALFLAAISHQLTAKAQIITTVAGGGTAQPGDGGPATDCKLGDPIGVAVDAAGNLYVAERAKHCIRKIAPSGNITTIAGTWGVAGYSGDGGPATAAKLNMPYAVILDDAGNIYFSEQLNNCIRKITNTGIISTIGGNGTAGYSGDGGPATNAQLSGAGFFARDNLGNIYIPDYDNHCVRKINASGIISTIAGGNGVDGPGKTGDGGQATDAKMNRPQGVTIDADGNLYVAEYGSNIIRKIAPSGIISTIAGTGTAGYNGENIEATSAQIKAPLDVITDNSGNLYICEHGNYRVRKISTSGLISTIAGTGINGSSGDGGPAISATFQTITGLCFDASGTLFINDIGTDKLRKINGVVAVTSVISYEGNMLSIYPVPNSGRFYVRVADDISHNSSAIVKVIAADGRVIMDKQFKTNETQFVELRATPGIYIVSLALGEQTFNQRIFITG